MPNYPAIRVDNLSIGYESAGLSKILLKNFDFTIAKGSLVGIIGANGCGKSTLLRTLANQQNKINGHIFVNGVEQDAFTPNNWAKSVSWVHTEYNFSKSLNVLELVTLGRQPYTNWLDKQTKSDLSIIEETLELCELTDLKHKKCYTLSDGQLQRAFIARAIAQDTPVILLDEPTTHLDVYHKVETLQLLKKLCVERQKTILFSSHEIELTLQICDQILSMRKNEINCLPTQDLMDSKILDSLFLSTSVYFDKERAAFRFKKKN